MIKLLYLLPVVLCLLWLAYLKSNGYRIAQGRQGFIYILIFSATIGGFYTLMMWLTQN